MSFKDQVTNGLANGLLVGIAIVAVVAIGFTCLVLWAAGAF